MSVIKLSIITVTFNCVGSIRPTLESVARLNNKRCEHIVIDGGSSDGTVEVINQYKSGLVYFVSEPDNGIFDAMNKGVSRANGEYILFLNSGDIVDKTFSIDEIHLPGNNAIVYFSYKIKGDERIYEPGIHHPFGLPTSHQATLIHKNIFNSYKFDTKYKVASDFNQHMLIRKNPAIAHIYYNNVLSVVLPGGFSSENTDQMLREYSEIIKKNCGLLMRIAYRIWNSKNYRHLNSTFRQKISMIHRIFK